ncbi:MAG: PA2779 family protein [Moraxellaceae bacterium]|nr:PA2779 family protein [Moraxellaceae bacterium]MDZ4297059.1 PA2779 family protein [Moraxellaceae bacterium]
MMKVARKAVAMVLMASTAVVSMPALAAPISADQIFNEQRSEQAMQERLAVAQWLQRDDVAAEMVRLGVNPAQAVERVSALSDAEVSRLYGQMDQAEVAGSLAGTLALIFVILLITDFLGLTKFFTFTRAVR